MKKIITGIIIFSLAFIYLPLCEAAQNSKFKDISTYKSGSMIIYSVYTSTKDFGEMQNYARSKKGIGGSKFVYFFNSLKNTPNISKAGMDFDTRFNKYWIGGYFKYANGREKFLEYPGRK